MGILDLHIHVCVCAGIHVQDMHMRAHVCIHTYVCAYTHLYAHTCA